MRSGRLRTRSFVMGLIGWCALSLAPVVALSPALAATFLLIALAKPVWTSRYVERHPAHVAVLLDTSRSMGLPAEQGGTRYQRGRDAIARIGG